MKRGPSEFRSITAAYAWCALRRSLRPLLQRDVRSMACVVVDDPSLAGYFENAASLLLSGTTRTVRFGDDDAVAQKVRKGKPNPTAMMVDLEYRKSLFLFESADDVPTSFRTSAEVFAIIGAPDRRLITAAVFHFRSVRISSEDAEFLTTIPLNEIAVALRKGVPVQRGIAKLRSSYRGGLVSSPSLIEATPAIKNPLENLHGYGAAIDWALQFCKDIADLKAGNIGWDSVDRGLLLFGPPGSGKTQFARELANAADLPLFVASYAQWQSEGHQGDMLRAMRQSFKEAIESAPSILLIDELASMTSREARMSDNSNYNRGVVNGFLECLDGLNRRDGVLVIATTNEVEVIDPAILRSGRIDTHIQIRLPDAEARFGILEGYLGFPIDDDHKPTIKRATEHNSGADLEVLARKAHRLARADGVSTSIDHLWNALPKVMVLPVERHRANSVHEAGHAVVGLAVGRTIVDAWLSDTYYEDRQVQSMGMVRFEIQVHHRRTRDVIFGELLIALAGVAAEIVITGRHDEGAAGAIGSDLDVATRLATTLEAVNGMGDTMVSEPYRGEPELRRIRQTNSIIWQRVEKTLHMALDQAKALIEENRDPIHAIAQELLRAKSVTGDEIQTLLSNKSLTIAKVEPSIGDSLKRSA